MRNQDEMPAKVILKITEGKLRGKEFVFDERTTCIVGRARDCHPQIPDDEHHWRISRHHCLLDINPPDIRVRDIGSLLGTYVNGSLIGQREPHMTPEEGAQMVFSEYDLKEGDEIKLADMAFRVSIFVPAVCMECSAEISEEKKAQALRAPGVYQCDACRRKAGLTRRQNAPVPPPRVCAMCGRDVSGEMGEHRRGAFLCASCKADPLQIVKLLLEQARRGDRDLLPIRGYTLLEELGRGGMGAVYRVRHDRTGEEVALKIMLPQVAVNERAKGLFLREVEITRALRHPHVVHLRESGCSNGTFFFTLEYCGGGSVARWMRESGGKLSIDEAGQIILQALDGLEYAHNAEISVSLADGSIVRERGVVHRDLKPANLLLSGSGGSRSAKVGDYGLAKAFDTAGLSGQTRTGANAGSPWFMPRQQVIHFKYASPEVDVWAMAASLYNMLTGRFPRDFPPGKDRWQVVLETRPVPIRERDASIPQGLAGVIDLALTDQPEIHFKTAAEFRRALEGVL